ncbi:hypothetical protein F4778DRAFT_779657 [Xylariomycetidae sp. FL2044]|nr:hypothetical protein F4778DRAFT_779657 [Xylariomycetidae sp. FL2044]
MRLPGLKRPFRSNKLDGVDPDEVFLGRTVSSQEPPTLGSSHAFRRRSEALGTFAPATSSSRPSSTAPQDRKNEPMGLHVVYEPAGRQSVDIIFVHGLGGTSRMSWSWNRDLSAFWPQKWLPLEPGFHDARIMTFGYNANFISPTKDIFNISDFAKDLLFQMKFCKDENLDSLDIGRVPVIFVVHSMGGLVIKKAYILGLGDPKYQAILGSVCSMVFLATPHRGSNLAEILNRLLKLTFQAPKQYISDLQRNSARIGDINDQFKWHSDNFQLVSFFETQPTSVGLRKMIIVERDSATLDYKNEISSPLDADHHNVCKPEGRSRKHHSFDGEGQKPSVDDLMTRLGGTPSPIDLTESIMEPYAQGSCNWILSDQNFLSFMDDAEAEPSVLHITGPPGAGKSVLASFLIQNLVSQALSTQFWYFRHDDQLRRSNRQCLLSLAFQTQSSLPEYSKRLLSLVKDMNSITKSDIRSLWQKLFLHTLDRLGAYGPLYWVIDAVDESESPAIFLSLVEQLKHVGFPLRMILLTRAQTVSKHLERVKKSLPTGRLSQIALMAPIESIRIYISEKLELTPWDDNLKDRITSSLLKKSQGNFLWLSLVIRELTTCDTMEQLEDVLHEVPWELSSVYERIEQTVSRDLRPADGPLARAIMSWVVCSERQLTEEELKEALKPTFSVLNLKHTISRLCGDFVSIDKKGNISLVHHTAKEFLTKSATTLLAVDPDEGHALISDRCLGVLMDSRFRIRLKSSGCKGLIRHCCLSWSYHMVRRNVNGDDYGYLKRMAAFFQSPTCLAWINAVAITGQLQILTSTAKGLTSYLERTRRSDADENHLAQPLDEMELLGQWSTELVRIVGKFGTHLANYPECIYSLVPLFCPPESITSQSFAPRDQLAPRITGISNTNWDDSLAKFTLGHGKWPKSIFCLHSTFGIITAEKCVNLYDASTFQEVGRFRHEETIVAAHINQQGTMLVTCGVKTIKVWDVASIRLLYSYSNPKRMRAVAASLSRGSTEIIICCVDSYLRRQLLSEPEEWQDIQYLVFKENAAGRGGGSPVCAAFSPDGSKLAVAHRASLMAVWDTETGNLIGRSESRHGRRITPTQMLDFCPRLTWNPVTEHVVGFFSSGTVFKWYPLDAHHEEMEDSVSATEIASSPDGRFLVTAQLDGSLKILNFENFSLMYTLNCKTRANALAISPDGKRIYDLRDSFCNVWEPNALIRMAEQDEKASDTASSHYGGSIAFSQVSEATAAVLDPITALCLAAGSRAYAFGDRKGKVKYLPSDMGERRDIRCSLFGLTCLTISSDGKRMATSCVVRRVGIYQILPSGELEEITSFKTKFEDPNCQLIFDKSGNHLLVQGKDCIQVWSLLSETPVCSQTNLFQDCCWMMDPLYEESFISVSASTIRRHDVSGPTFTLEKSIEVGLVVCPERLDASWDQASPLGFSELAIRVLGAFHRRYSNLRRKDSNGDKRSIQSLLIDISPLSREGPLKPPTALDEEESPRLGRQLPLAISSSIEVPLGFVLDSAGHSPLVPQRWSLAFIDHDFWVCTWSIDDVNGKGGHRRHFFLPRDWINMDCLRLARVSADGRFFCPRNGEVAVVHNGLKDIFSS